MADHRKLLGFYESFVDKTSLGHEEAKRRRSYVNNQQWTEEEEAKIKARKQPIITDNAIKRKTDYFLGIERQTRTDPKAYPRTPEHDDEGEAFTDAIRFVCDNNDWDIIVWGGLNHVNARRCPEMFGWIDYDVKTLDISNISVKKPIDDSLSHPIAIGMFTFRNANILQQCIEALVAKNHRINNEFYLDSAVNEALKIGYRCKIFNVDHFISFGTPNDLRTFEYWQSCFHKWDAHPYNLKIDSKVPKKAINYLESKFSTFNENSR